MMRFKEGEQAILLYCRTNPHKPPHAGEIVTVLYVGPYRAAEVCPTGLRTMLGGDYVIGGPEAAQDHHKTRCVLDAQLAKLEMPAGETDEVSEELEEDV